MKKKHIILFILLLFLASCVREPTSPELNDTPANSQDAAFILCEGVWGMDNSVLVRYDIAKDSSDVDFYGTANPGFKLGDLANDIAISDDVALIAVTTARTIEVVNKNNGKSLGRINYPNGSAPRRIAVIDDSTAAVTDLYRHSVSLINYRSFKILIDNKPVGPAPEGIAYRDGLLFVVNSGYGDYLADKPKAGTVSVVDVSTMTEIGNFYAGPNPIEILISKQTDRLYVSFNNLPSKKDSAGGIIEYDLSNLKELRRTRTDVRSMTLSSTGDTLFFISVRGVEMIELKKNFQPGNIIPKSNKNDDWYSLAQSSDRRLWVGNSFNHQIKGEVSIYAPNSTSVQKKFPVGVNPGKIIFY